MVKTKGDADAKHPSEAKLRNFRWKGKKEAHRHATGAAPDIWSGSRWA